MAFTSNITYDTAASLSFSSTYVEVSAGVLRLKDQGGGTFTTTPQLVQTQHQVMISSLTSITEVTSLGAGSTVTYQLVLNGVAYWFNSLGVWVKSDGTSATSNTAAVISTNASTLFSSLSLLVPQYLTLNIWLTGTASTRPSLTSNALNYTFTNGNPVAPSQCLVYGNLLDLIGARIVPTTLQPISFEVQSDRGFFHGNNFVVPFTRSASFDNSGYFQLSVIETATPGVKLNFYFRYYDGASVKCTRLVNMIVPNTPTLPIAQITAVNPVDFG